MPPEKDWRAPLDEAGDDALQYSDIAIGYLGRNARYRSDYRRALGRVKRGAISADDATAALVDRWGISYHAAPGAAFDRKLAVARPDLSPASIIVAPAVAGIGAGPLDMAALGDIRARIAVLAAEVQAARLLSLRSIELSSGDYTPLVESAMAKVFASELSQKLTETAIDIFGPAAMVDGPAEGDVADGLVGQLLRRSIMMVVGGGSNEIQRNVIALRGLRLPSK